MGGCVHASADDRGVGQIYDQHFIEYTYKDGTKMLQPMPPAAGPVGAGVPVHPRRQGRQKLRRLGQRRLQRRSTSDLVNAIRQGGKLNDGWHGATSSFTAVLGRMATYFGHEVDWDEAVAKGPSEMPGRFAYDADPPALPDKDGNYPIPLPGIYKPY